MKSIFFPLIVFVLCPFIYAVGMKYDCPGSSFILACRAYDIGTLISAECQCYIKGFENTIPDDFTTKCTCEKDPSLHPACYHNNAFSPEIDCFCLNDWGGRYDCD